MNKKTVRFVSLIFLLLFLFASMSVLASAGLAINPKFSVGKNQCQSLAEAFEKAGAVDTITQDKQVPEYEVSESISVTKNITLVTGRDFNDFINKIHYTGTSEPLFIIQDGGVLTLKGSFSISGNTNIENLRGGLIRVEKGGTLILEATEEDPVVISDCKLTAPGAKGGAIYVCNGGTVIDHGATFQNNSASDGADIYTEPEKSVIDQDDEEESGFPVILWILVGLAVIASAGGVVYFVLNRKRLE